MSEMSNQKGIVMPAAETVYSEALPANLSSPRIDKIAVALSKAQGEVDDAIAESTGKVSDKASYKYANLHSIYKVARKVIKENGLLIVNHFAPNNMVRIILVHSSTQWFDYGEYPIGNPAEHKARGGALTYIRRFSTKTIFGIADVDDEEEDEKGNEALGRKPEYTPPPGHPASDVPAAARKESYEAAKREYKIAQKLGKDGTIDFDDFAGGLESELIKEGLKLNDVSMLKKANSLTLTLLKDERPDLYESLVKTFNEVGSKLM